MKRMNECDWTRPCGAAGEASGANIHASKMMGFTSVFGVLAPLGHPWPSEEGEME